MKLTDRLLKIASLVSDGKKIADIGTDHGYIPVYLLKEGKVPFAVLADVNKGPLDNAHKEVIQNNLLDKVDLRLGSGIEILEIGEVEEVIIAGMGGILISELLEAKKEVAHNVEKLILQPMQAQEELRYYLLNNGYEILEEVLVREDFRIYEIIVAKYTGKNTIIEDEIYYEV
nr:class I SAM-dependent methyltransferase [Clostridioides difficile]